MNEKRLFELLSRRQSGELSLLEQKELKELIEQHPDLERLANYINTVFDTELTFSDNYKEAYIDARWESLSRKIPQPVHAPSVQRPLKPFTYWFLRIAAALLIVAVLGIVLRKVKNQGDDKLQVVATKKGTKTRLMLPDGSQVWINADSRLSYDKDFGKRMREVTLSGEAYFDVAKDASRPFIVRTPALNIKVVGTAFNVSAYENDKNTEAVLLRGVIEVTFNKGSHKRITMKPNEKLVVENDYNSIAGNNIKKGIPVLPVMVSPVKKPEGDSVAIEAQWVENTLAFYNKRLDDICAQLSRWYGIEIDIAADQLKSTTYSGTFKEESIEDVLNALKLTGGFHYKKDGERIIINL